MSDTQFSRRHSIWEQRELDIYLQEELELPRFFLDVNGSVHDRDVTGRFASRKEFDKQEKQFTQSIRRF